MISLRLILKILQLRISQLSTSMFLQKTYSYKKERVHQSQEKRT